MGIKKSKVLDHGFVELDAVMGSDRDIERAARQSYVGTEEEVRLPEQTRGLLRYLMRHWHTTPFEMAELRFRVALPIFVERQWIRHRTASTNEFSGRYAEMPDLFYVPEEARIQGQGSSNKQCSDGEQVELAMHAREEIVRDHAASRFTYKKLLAMGVARETAREVLPPAQYTVKMWKLNLHNLLNFIRLRAHAHAQWEIQQYAAVIADMVRENFPITWEAFEDYRLYSCTFSRMEMDLIRKCLGGLDFSMMPGWSDLPAREQREFMGKLAGHDQYCALSKNVP